MPAKVASPRPVHVLPSRAAALQAVRKLLPGIRARARLVDTGRHVSEQTIEELLSAGLFGVLTPKSLGGSELGFATLFDVCAEIASACGSTGWIYGVLAGHSWMLNLFPMEAQREVFADSRALASTVFRFSAEVKPEKDGYRMKKGEGRFCSGIDHVGWVVLGCSVTREDGGTEQKFLAVPKSDLSEIVDDWFVAGMRGTGSKTIRIDEAFVPGHRSVSVEAMDTGKAPGALHHLGAIYRMSWRNLAPFSLVGVPIGIGHAAVTTFADSLRKAMQSWSPEQIADQSATLARLAVASAEVDAAHATVLENALLVDGALHADEFKSVETARLLRDWAYAAQVARGAVTSLFEASGGSATFDYSELQRLWRDANASAQHIAFNWDNAMSAYGRALIGVAPAKMRPKI